MRKIKLIRIDEMPRKFSQGSLKILMDQGPGAPSFGKDKQFPKSSFPTSPMSFNRGQGMGGQMFPGNKPGMQPGEQPEGVEMPQHIISHLVKTNDLIVAFNTELEQRKVPKEYLHEYQHDSFKIGLKITEGIFLQSMQPSLAGRQFDLSIIHIENTIITLENFAVERIGSAYKVGALKKACTELIPYIEELKEYFELD